MTRIIAVALAAIAALLIVPPWPASASPMSYIQELNNHGFVVYDMTAALATGAQVCEALNVRDPYMVAYNLFVNSSWTDTPTPAHARAWVIIAIEELCPWHDARRLYS